MFRSPSKKSSNSSNSPEKEGATPRVDKSEDLETEADGTRVKRTFTTYGQKQEGFQFWYNEARRYVKSGFLNKGIGVINNYQEIIMKTLPLDERLKCCRLLLFCLNRLIERKYLARSKLPHNDKVLESLQLGILYIRIFQESLNGFLDDHNPYLKKTTRSPSISLQSPLKNRRSTSTGSSNGALNMNTFEVNMNKRFSRGFWSLKNEEEETDTLAGFFYDNSMKKNPPCKRKMKIYVNDFMINYLKVVLNYAIYYKKIGHVPMAAKLFHSSMEIVGEFEVNASLDSEIIKIIIHTRICLGNFFNEVQCFNDAISNFELAIELLQTEMNLLYNTATKMSVMNILLDNSNKKLLRCVKKMLVALYNVSFSYEYSENYAKCLESLKLASWLGGRYLDQNNNLLRTINSHLKLIKTQYTTFLKDTNEINRVCQIAFGRDNEETQKKENRGHNLRTAESNEFYQEYLYQKYGGDQINNRFVVVFENTNQASKASEQVSEQTSNEDKRASALSRGHRKMKTVTDIIRAESLKKHTRTGSDLTNATTDTNVLSADFNKPFDGISIDTEFKAFINTEEGSVNSVGGSRTRLVSDKNSLLSTTESVFMRIKNDFGEVLSKPKYKRDLKDLKIGKSVTDQGVISPKNELRITRPVFSLPSNLQPELLSNRSRPSRDQMPKIKKPNILTTDKYFKKIPTMEQKLMQIKREKEGLKPKIYDNDEDSDLERKNKQLDIMKDLTSETLDNYFEKFITKNMNTSINIKPLADLAEEVHEQLKEEDFDKKEFSTASKILKLRKKFGTGKSLPGIFKGIGEYNAVDESRKVENQADTSFGVFTAERKYLEKLKILKYLQNEKEKSEFESKLISKPEDERAVDKLRALIRKNKKTILSGYFQHKLKINVNNSPRRTVFEQSPLPRKLEKADQAKISTSLKKQNERTKMLLEKCEKNIEEINSDQTKLIKKHFKRKLRYGAGFSSLDRHGGEDSSQDRIHTLKDLAESTYLLAVKQSKLADLKSIFTTGGNKDKKQKFSNLISTIDSIQEGASQNKKKIVGALKRMNTRSSASMNMHIIKESQHNDLKEDEEGANS